LKTVKKVVRHFLGKKEGTTSMEYALIACLIAVAIILAVSALSNSTIALYQYWTQAVTQAVTAAAS
jgi:Flp pilus assembly pilin Flp